MAKVVIAAAVITAAMGLCVPACYAFGDSPWCAVIGTDSEGVYWDCQYRTFEDCAPHVVAGDRGFCDENPWPGPANSVALVRPIHRKRHVAHH
jgi:hypothetical protein